MNSSSPYRFIQSMRWFGPTDAVSLSDIRQSGCSGVVTALHHIPNGEVWSIEEIQQRKDEIQHAGMQWTVVESVPVHEAIKTQHGSFESYIQNYISTIRNLSTCGISVITYNFMPVLDWTRTDLAYVVDDGSKALRFDRTDLAVFDLFILQRDNAASDYSAEIIERAQHRFAGMSASGKSLLQRNIIAGLPGSEEGYSADQLNTALSRYHSINEAALRTHLLHFLSQIIPVAEECGIVMALHPDDPPFSILGLPRIVKNGSDIDELVRAIPSRSNGLCFCSGSLGVSPQNDLPSLIKRYADRIHFVHLRNIRRENDGSFFEDDHLNGNVDMVQVVRELITVMKTRELSLPMRPDHGHQMLDDLRKNTNPGYSAIGRLRGLAELRGLEVGLAQH